jgi:hypothetical protein
MRGFSFIAIAASTLVACQRAPRTTTLRPVPTPSVQVGACATPGRDGVMSAAPRLERADRDLDADGRREPIVVDRALCTGEGNCYWNVFVGPPEGSSDCARFAGTFEAADLERLPTKGDDNMADVRGRWNLHGRRMLLQSYRFRRGGYRLVDAQLCKQPADDKLVCAETEH